jgi:hypothetical protein
MHRRRRRRARTFGQRLAGADEGLAVGDRHVGAGALRACRGIVEGLRAVTQRKVLLSDQELERGRHSDAPGLDAQVQRGGVVASGTGLVRGGDQTLPLGLGGGLCPQVFRPHDE